jgi:predicted lipid-binding transport protein (Tim44 family)
MENIEQDLVALLDREARKADRFGKAARAGGFSAPTVARSNNHHPLLGMGLGAGLVRVGLLLLAVFGLLAAVAAVLVGLEQKEFEESAPVQSAQSPSPGFPEQPVENSSADSQHSSEVEKQSKTAEASTSPRVVGYTWNPAGPADLLQLHLRSPAIVECRILSSN